MSKDSSNVPTLNQDFPIATNPASDSSYLAYPNGMRGDDMFDAPFPQAAAADTRTQEEIDHSIGRGILSRDNSYGKWGVAGPPMMDFSFKG